MARLFPYYGAPLRCVSQQSTRTHMCNPQVETLYLQRVCKRRSASCCCFDVKGPHVLSSNGEHVPANANARSPSNRAGGHALQRLLDVSSRHLIQCCTFIAKKTTSYTFWQLVLFKHICGASFLFFKLDVSLLQTKCSYAILYCMVAVGQRSNLDGLLWLLAVSGNTQIGWGWHFEFKKQRSGNRAVQSNACVTAFEFTSLLIPFFSFLFFLHWTCFKVRCIGGCKSCPHVVFGAEWTDMLTMTFDTVFHLRPSAPSLVFLSGPVSMLTQGPFHWTEEATSSTSSSATELLQTPQFGGGVAFYGACSYCVRRPEGALKYCLLKMFKSSYRSPFVEPLSMKNVMFSFLSSQNAIQVEEEQTEVVSY